MNGARSGSSHRFRLLRWSRRISQALFVGLFLYLFISTDYSGSDTINQAVNVLFRIDPLLALVTMLAARTVIALMAPALLVVFLSLVAGRTFCGWLCPLGTLLDASRPLVTARRTDNRTLWPWLGTTILVFLVVAALVRVPLAGYVDPFSILVRGLAVAIYPSFNAAADTFFTLTYQHGPDFINAVTEPLYGVLRDTVLPFTQHYFDLALISGVMLIGVFLLELIRRRFFCRTICPLGSMLGLCASVGVMRLRGGDDECGNCRLCGATCRMGAIDAERRIDMRFCIVCMDCLVRCPRQVIDFTVSRTGAPQPAISSRRRQLVAAGAAALALAPLLGVSRVRARPAGGPIRPPGALAEAEFLQRCVRCAECIQVCIGNALQPAWLESGFEGIFSPHLVARTGYCEFNCTLCGQVCPTGAIKHLTLTDKQTTKIGTAWFDTTRCLPYARGVSCIVCEEHCPTPDKAIKFQLVEVIDQFGVRVLVKQPYVIDELCIGCGICETKCPLPGASAVRVTSEGESRNPDSFLPQRSEDLGYG
jgi:polyferredoxin